MRLVNGHIKQIYILNLIWVFYTRPCWVSLNNSKTIKAVPLLFCSIQQYFIKAIIAKFGIPKFSQSPDIGHNSDVGIFDFQIFGQSLKKENCLDDIDMKHGPVTKLTKRNKRTSKKLTMTSCQKVVTSLPFFRFMANLKLSGSRIRDAQSVKLCVIFK